MNSVKILDTIPAHLLRLDDNGTVHEFYITDGVSGHPMPERCETNINTLFSDDVSQHYLHNIEKLKSGDRLVSFDYVITHNGEQHHFKANGSHQDNDYLFIIQTAIQNTDTKQEKEKLYEQFRKAQKMEALGRGLGRDVRRPRGPRSGRPHALGADSRQGRAHRRARPGGIPEPHSAARRSGTTRCPRRTAPPPRSRA